MAQPYVGEIRMFAGNFNPNGWMFCEGQLLPISEFETLFNLIGTMYGGDGQSTFQLPDLRGRIPLHLLLVPPYPQRLAPMLRSVCRSSLLLVRQVVCSLGLCGQINPRSS